MLISVVIPTHNRPALLAEAIASVRAQTFTDYEIIVVSNGESLDGRRASREVAVAASCAYFEIDEGNASIARNAGVLNSQGEWIAFLDDDDLWLPNKLERQITEAKRTGADVISCDYVEFFPDGSEAVRQPRLINGWSFAKATSHLYWWSVMPATMVRKVVFERVGGFDPRFRYGEDSDIWRRVSWDHSLYQVEEILVRVRRGHPSLTQHMRARCLDDLRHYRKMRRDTPTNLRWAIPSAVVFILPRLIMMLVPVWIQRRLRPRSRWIRFRRWLQTQVWRST